MSSSFTRPNGISNSGKKAEELFRDITGATLSEHRTEGDAILEGNPVEIKQVSARANSATINQIRPVKYLPLVILDQRSGQWFVISPDKIVGLAAKKRRGQHTENPFESIAFSLSAIKAVPVSEEELRSKTLAAIAQGNRKPALKAAMQEIRKECSRLAERSRGLVEQAMREGHS